MGKLVATATFVAVCGLGVWGFDRLDGRSYSLRVVSSTDLLALAPSKYPDHNNLVATLAPGASLEVIRQRYGKDFRAFEVATAEGRTGWVVEGPSLLVLP